MYGLYGTISLCLVCMLKIPRFTRYDGLGLTERGRAMGCIQTNRRGLHKLELQDFDFLLDEFDGINNNEYLQTIQVLVDSGVVWSMPSKVSCHVAGLIKAGLVQSRHTLDKEELLDAVT